MNCRRFLPSIALVFPLFCLLVLLGVPVSLSNPELFENCRDVEFKCGNISAKYPFSGERRKYECGHPDLQLRCEDGTITMMEIDYVEYQVLDIHPDTLRIARRDLFQNGLCTPQIETGLKNSDLFELAVAPGSAYINLTLLYDCPSLSSITLPPMFGNFSCGPEGSSYENFSAIAGTVPANGTCPANVTVPILENSLEGISPVLLKDILKAGFEVRWKLDKKACDKCFDTQGACGFNYSNQTVCYCQYANPNWQAATECRTKGTGLLISFDKLIIGLPIVAATIVVMCVFTRYKTRQRKTNANATVEAFVREYGTLAPKRYSYTDIKKMTNKFKEKLGQGGFGSVYKGKLPDGRLVAVKLLSQSKGNGEDFMNEVGSISRTSHVNVVTLLGFCCNGSKRALVFEFMPHGSLDKFIYNGRSMNQNRLEWKLLYDIIFGIARGLEYLHQGCNTRILHFDIKPHNILLDVNFCPKISDFGLSKLCERNESIISMTGARGTIGFIAPEVFCRNFGGVSYKSDVYSYGMMVLEMVGGRKNIDVGVSQTSEIYFPSWIYNYLDQPMNLKLDGVTTEEEDEIARKLIVVSLWCIQTTPSDRPSMTKVLEMLQGTLQAVPVPPRPFVSSSPVRSPITSSTMSTMAMS